VAIARFPGEITVNDLVAAYSQCQRLARRAASNFYFSFLLLPRQKRRSMCALYAYLRQVDDLGDDESRDIASRRQSLAEMRNRLDAALNGNATDPVLLALADTASRYRIPREYLTAVIDGVEMDLAGKCYETFAELEEYCYRVASAVGLACIHIWGFRGPQALEPARRCGIAFQLINILRDLREDSRRGRIYLPHEDLRKFHYTAEELNRCEANDRFTELMRFEIDRAQRYFDSAPQLEPLLEPDGRRVLRAMGAAYHRLLEKIQRRPADVLQRRIRLRTWEKLRIAAGALLARPQSAWSGSSCETMSS
jgi:phytoene synthase